ncbi:exported hypothetical protein [Nostocoides japonicum T1-X7]|uniref:RCC1-like domain-containing protein n=2 Tax=Nostocoides japonicum TaxID=99481 RepID=A0A077M101_9MICO|nr:exported hypothetical protein [Tetrasphaera japonica T1-X7]
MALVGWLIAALAMAAGVGLASPAPAVAATLSTYTQNGTGLVALTPARLLDTRTGNGAPVGSVKAKSTTALRVTGRGGVPSAGVAAVVLNVTVTAPAQSGYVTAWPAGAARPTASNVNYARGQTVADQAIVKVGTGGVVDLYSYASSHLVVDVTGYFPTGAAYDPLVPSRLLDTRLGVEPADGSTTTVTVTGRGGVPATGAAAVVLTVTAVGAAGKGYLTAWPAGVARPTASTLNYEPGQTTAGMVIAKVGANGQVSVYTQQRAHLVVDVSGWIPTTSDYTPLTPTRFLDTRNATGAPKARVPAGGSVTLQVTGTGGVPADGVNAVEANVTVASPTSSGYVTAYPAGVSRPTASTVNYVGGVNRANSITVKVGTAGKVTLYSYANTDLVVDIVGYFNIPTQVALTHDQDTIVVPAAATQSVAAPTTPGGTGTITTTAAGPAAVGQYVYLPPGGANGDGVVGQVTAVNGTTTNVVNVPLQQAFASGSIVGTSAADGAPITAEDGKGTNRAVPHRGDIVQPCGQIDSKVTFTPRYSTHVESHWGLGQAPYFKGSVDVSLTGTWTLGGNIAIDCNIPVPGPTIALPPIGPIVPVVTTGAEVKLSGPLSKIPVTTVGAFGVTAEYANGTLTSSTHQSLKFQVGTIQPSGSTTVTGRLSAGPEVDFVIAGVIGPSIKGRLFVEGDLTPAASHLLSVYGGVSVGASFDLRLVFFKVSVALAEKDLWRTQLWQSPSGGSGSGSVKQISAGAGHMCAVLVSGVAKCWGDNSSGELGNGTTTGSLVPVPVTGLGAGVASIGAGYDHTCAVLTTGAVKCWGDNYFGQLGNGAATGGTSSASLVPVPVTGLVARAVSIIVGDDHTCAVLTTGAAECWGDNYYGELGNGTTTTSSVPVTVTGLDARITSIDAGSNHTCAVLTTGAAKCWGDNHSGELGNGTTTNSSVPVTVTGLDAGVASISAGTAKTCAVLTSGAARCWGSNDHGQLGNGTTSDSSVPVTVTGLNAGVASISAGYGHTCAVLSSGAAKCWGYNFFGQLGNGTTNDISAPVPIPVPVTGLGAGVASIIAGYVQSCAVLTSGAADCWGYNSAGQLGNGTTNDSSVPVPVIGL